MPRALAVLLTALVVGLAAPAAGAAAPVDGSRPYVDLTFLPASNLHVAPPGFSVTPATAVAVAKHSPTAQRIHRREHPLAYVVYVWRGHYEVVFYYHRQAVADVIVSSAGRLGPTYTGGLIIGVYARGHYDSLFDSPWVFLPFTVMFLIPLIGGRLGWGHLDLAMVLGFGISYYLFDTQHLEAAVWLAYPPLLYLLARMLLRGRRPTGSGRALAPALPLAVMGGGVLLLAAARIFLCLEQSSVVDVGYASAGGAFRILHGLSLYGSSVAAHGDTYGPVNYLAYAPFEALWPAAWRTLPAARAAAITFDLATISALLALGLRLRPGRGGLRLGLLLAWLWAACPFTLLGVIKSTNDGLIALLVVLMVLAAAHPARRGVLVGLAAAAKFTPAILLGLMLRGLAPRRREARVALAAFTVVAAGSIALFLPAGGLSELWRRTIGYQLIRTDIFSLWALHPGLAPVKDLIAVAVAALAVLVSVRPRGPRSLPQVAALGAALMIAVQLPAVHWFYLYIVWFLPLVLIAVLAGEPPAAVSAATEPGTLAEAELERPLVLAGAH